MTMKLGIIGLGKMGSNLSLQCVDKGIEVYAHSKHRHFKLEEQGVHIVTDYKFYQEVLETPRIFYLSLPAGSIIDEVLVELVPYLSKGDVIMDGGNSFYLDSIRREKELWEKGIYFLDCGTSGGISGARYGACFMVGGKEEGFKIVEPVLNALAVPGGVIHTGAPGSGHYVKLVHNGIEFGMNRAIGEGMELLLNSDFDLDIAKIFDNWSHGSVIRGWLIELMAKGLKEQDFEKIPPYIEDTGEVNWLVQLAIDKEIAIPLISLCIMNLFQSRDRGKDVYRAIALLRHEYGGHPFGADEHIAEERKSSRITRI